VQARAPPRCARAPPRPRRHHRRRRRAPRPTARAARRPGAPSAHHPPLTTTLRAALNPLRAPFSPPSQARSLLPEEALEALWLQAVALYDDSPNPAPDFASVAATRRALRASDLVDASAFDVVVVAVLGRAMHERGDATLMDYDQARSERERASARTHLCASFARVHRGLRDACAPPLARVCAQFCEVMAALMPGSPAGGEVYDIDQWG
jgi:hypothetical protein